VRGEDAIARRSSIMTRVIGPNKGQHQRNRLERGPKYSQLLKTIRSLGKTRTR